MQARPFYKQKQYIAPLVWKDLAYKIELVNLCQKVLWDQLLVLYKSILQALNTHIYVYHAERLGQGTDLVKNNCTIFANIVKILTNILLFLPVLAKS